MKISRIRKACGEKPPRFYRFAWFDVVTGCYHCYPIGIHLLVRWFVHFLDWTWKYTPSQRELDMTTAEERGYNRGFTDGHETGHRNGIKAYLEKSTKP